jgi:hypothetical protein
MLFLKVSISAIPESTFFGFGVFLKVSILAIWGVSERVDFGPPTPPLFLAGKATKKG